MRPTITFRRMPVRVLPEGNAAKIQKRSLLYRIAAYKFDTHIELRLLFVEKKNGYMHLNFILFTFAIYKITCIYIATFTLQYWC